jgi:hypothetical protein
MTFSSRIAELRINDKCPVSSISVRRFLLRLEIFDGIVVFVGIRIVEAVVLGVVEVDWSVAEVVVSSLGVTNCIVGWGTELFSAK